MTKETEDRASGVTMSAKPTADQETKIERCPGCGGEPPYIYAVKGKQFNTGHDRWSVECGHIECYYRSPRRPTESAAIAAHNALATASARPKDVEPVNSNYRQIAFDIAEKIGVETANALGRAGDEETIRLYRVTFYDFITNKLSELMQTRDVGNEMKWTTTDKPTKPGWYPYKHSQHSEDWQVVEIYLGRGLMVRWGSGSTAPLGAVCKHYPGCQWAGPIEKPK